MPIEQIENRNFRHLVMDIFWFGLALPATSRFVAVYAIRVGASAAEISLLTALPALILLFSASLSRWWNARYPDAAKATFLPGLGFRFSFLLPAFTPFMPHEWQPEWLIFSIALPAIAQGIASVSFLIMLREALSIDRLTSLVSRRNFAMNAGLAFSTFGLGFWLTNAPFPLNYQAMFVMAFILTLVSLWHVAQTRSVFLTRTLVLQIGNPKYHPWRDRKFYPVIGLVLSTHLAFFAVFPLIPYYLVHGRGADEQFMSFFVLAELAGGALIALYVPQLIHRFGNRHMVALGMIGTAVSTFVIVFAPTLSLTLLGGFINGASWTISGTAIYGYFNQKISQDQVPAYTICYNQVLYIGMFVGPMLGSLLLDWQMPMAGVLTFGAMLRFFTGAVLGGDAFSKMRNYSATRTIRARA